MEHKEYLLKIQAQSIHGLGDAGRTKPSCTSHIYTHRHTWMIDSRLAFSRALVAKNRHKFYFLIPILLL